MAPSESIEINLINKVSLLGIKLVAKSYNQEENINYDKSFALIARLKAIRMLVAFTFYMDFKLLQMDINSAFLNGYI